MSELPSFLAQTGPAAYTLTLSASAAETLMLCGAKYSWSRITGIEAATPRAGQNYGKALHLALGHRYEHQERSIRECEEVAERILAQHFTEHPQPELRGNKPEWRTQARAMQAFRAYNAAYPAEDFEVVGVEEPFEVALGAFQYPLVGFTADLEGNFKRQLEGTVTVKFRGIRDLRVRWHDQLWVLDHKTSTEWSDLVVDEGKASFQFQGYGWVEKELQRQACANAEQAGWEKPKSMADAEQWIQGFGGGVRRELEKLLLPVGGVIGNYLISRENYSNPDRKPTPRDLPRDQFVRQAYPYSDAELGEWHADAMDVAREIFERWQSENWPRRRTACAHWGRCEYYQLCWETEPAYRLAAAMGADYRPRTPSPFEDEANGKRE